MVKAFVMIRVGVGEQLSWMKTVKEKIENTSGVSEANLVLGRYDIIAEVEAKDIDGIIHIVDDKIRGISGVTSTETFIAY